MNWSKGNFKIIGSQFRCCQKFIEIRRKKLNGSKNILKSNRMHLHHFRQIRQKRKKELKRERYFFHCESKYTHILKYYWIIRRLLFHSMFLLLFQQNVVPEMRGWAHEPKWINKNLWKIVEDDLKLLLSLNRFFPNWISTSVECT